MTPAQFIAVEAAVRAACRVTQAVSDGEITQVIKADDSPVTVADFAAQAVIVARLQTALDTPVIIGEESASRLVADTSLRAAVTAAARVAWPDAQERDVLAAIDAAALRDHDGTYWALDPVDGTKGFLRREQYAVCLALVEGASPTVGLLGCPNLAVGADNSPALPRGGGVIYGTYGGRSVEFVGLDEDSGRSSLARQATPLPATLVVTHSVESGHTRLDKVAAVMNRLQRPWRALACDSQCKYALVARGQAHAYLRIPTDPSRIEMVWDHAAGVVIAAQAGMRVTDLRGAPFDFSSPRGLVHNYGILCAHPALHDELLAAVRMLGYAA